MNGNRLKSREKRFLKSENGNRSKSFPMNEPAKSISEPAAKNVKMTAVIIEAKMNSASPTMSPITVNFPIAAAVFGLSFRQTR